MRKEVESLLDSTVEKAEKTVDRAADMAEREGLRLVAFGKRFLAPARQQPGLLAHVLHRATGVFILLYLFIHIATVANANFDHRSFDELMRILVSPPFLLFSWVLFVVIVYHAANGIRITLFDAGVGTARQKGLFLGVASVTLLFAMWSGYQFLPLIFERLRSGGP
ncbi:MAG: succinate dehydrogenase, cytochrome b556 subunit [Halobacteria archaeon]